MSDRMGLPARLEGVALESVRQALLQRRGQALDLIGASVERMDGLGLQLLLSALATWRRDGFALRLIEPSDSLARTLTDLGLRADFEGGAA